MATENPTIAHLERKSVLPSPKPHAADMGLEIIGAGFGRTGTFSLKAALEQLGYNKCYHMKEAIERPDDFDIFIDALNDKKPDWDAVFKGYKATVDWPACSFYKQLMAKYPKAKVLLSVRDPERWYESAANTIFASRNLETEDERINSLTSKIEKIVWEADFDGRFGEKQHAISVFEKHIEEVKAYVPAEKLLVFNVKEGWEPLCDFLGKPVPDTPFPHLNDRETFRKILEMD